MSRWLLKLEKNSIFLYFVKLTNGFNNKVNYSCSNDDDDEFELIQNWISKQTMYMAGYKMYE